MSRSTADLAALKAELTNDPKGLGLTMLPEDDAVNADRLNEVRDELTIDRESIPASEVIRSIDLDEFVSASDQHRQWIGILASLSAIDPSNGNEVREGLLQVFGDGTETRGNLVGLLTEPANRINQMLKEGLLEAGGAVTPSDISQARQA